MKKAKKKNLSKAIEELKSKVDEHSESLDSIIDSVSKLNWKLDNAQKELKAQSYFGSVKKEVDEHLEHVKKLRQDVAKCVAEIEGMRAEFDGILESC